MPTLPPEIERPAGPTERLSMAAHRAGAAIGGTSRVRARAILLAILVTSSAALAPLPFNLIGIAAGLLMLVEMSSRNR